MSRVIIVLIVVVISAPALAYNSIAAVGVANVEGPGAGLETASPLTLPTNHLSLMLKGEHVAFRKFGFANPENKITFDFYTLAIGYGINQYLSVYLFQPYSIKVQQTHGTASGFADMSLMLRLGFKYAKEIMLIPATETLDDLMDWHFSVSIATTLPFGNAVRKDKNGVYFSPDMQNGFGVMSPSIDAAVMKQLNDKFTWLADISYQYFPEHKFPSTTHQLGAEARLSTSVVYQLFKTSTVRMDIIAEVSVLNLQRDKKTDESGSPKNLRASGGTIIYGIAGVRFLYDRLSIGIGGKIAMFSSLNEKSEQQGSEGLEDYRLFAILGYCFGL